MVSLRALLHNSLGYDQPLQHGFLSSQSCPSNLLIIEETITRLVDDWDTADEAYLDFAKAFDSANHKFL